LQVGAQRARARNELGFLPERDKELVRGDSGLFKYAAKSAYLDLAMIQNDATGGASMQNDVPRWRITAKPSRDENCCEDHV
jgi:hypothetical protein